MFVLPVRGGILRLFPSSSPEKMNRLGLFKTALIAKMTSRFPSFAKLFSLSYEPTESEGIPWTPIKKPLADCKVAMVTTAGVHQKDQKPFNMEDPKGDPAFRVIDITNPLSSLMITHDYYEHSDADRDINIVFPVERLKEFELEGIINKVADVHYGFMGHILSPHIEILINETAPEVAKRLKADGVDAVLLTPG
jgi:D-proline reductase (dithiol) PrdB